jgi:hypothetical protein
VEFGANLRSNINFPVLMYVCATCIYIRTQSTIFMFFNVVLLR